MTFHQHIKTRLGEIWIADATAHGFSKMETESRQEFEARFLKKMLSSLVENAELDHEASGAPILKSHPEWNVSISHSENWFALYFRKKNSTSESILKHSTIEFKG